jgi:hypothetical protein
MIPRITIPIALWCSKSRRVITQPLLVILMLCGTSAIAGDGRWPSFTATMLSREIVHSDKLLGQPTLLILTPSRNAAESTL